MLQTRIRKDFTEPYFFLDADLDGADLTAVLRRLEEQALSTLGEEGVPEGQRSVAHSVDIRYEAQEYTLTVPITDAADPSTPDFLKVVAERFAEMHHSRYGHANPGAPIEFVTVRTAAFGDLGRPEPQKWPHAEKPEFPHEVKQVVFGGTPCDTTVVRRDDLLAGHTFAGPGVVVEDTATTVVPPGYSVSVDEIGSLIIRNKEQA